MSITKKQIHNIVSEELKILLKESQTQDEGILDMFKKGKNKERSADDLAALDALRGMPTKSRMDARDVSVTGYKDLASKERSKAPVMKNKSYSLEEEHPDDGEGAKSYSLEEEPDDFERFTDTPGYEDERVPGKTAHQRKRADLPAEEPKYDDSHLRSLGYLEEGDDYPAPSKMKKLVAQAKLNARYQPSDEDQLKRDYDEHVRNTLRDPIHSQAHKRE